MSEFEEFIKEAKKRKRVILVNIENEWDVVMARREIRRLAEEVGFDEVDQARLTMSLAELAKNIILYAGKGKIFMWKSIHKGEVNVNILAEDEGPGISDWDLKRGFILQKSTGLASVKQLADKFFLKSSPGRGCIVGIKKILRK